MAVKGAKNKRVVEQQQEAVLEKVKDMTFDAVTKELAGVQVELQKTMADLSGKLAEQFQLLEDVQKTISLKKHELKQLHQIEATATTLDELLADIEERKTEQVEEEAEFKRRLNEEKTEQKKVWAREQQDFQYEQQKKNKLSEDALAESILQQKKSNKDKQEQLDKNWAEREAELKKREQELAELRAFKEAAPEMVKKAVNQEVAIANNSLKKEYEHQRVILQKDAEMDKKLAEAQKVADAQTISKLQTQVTALEKQLELANQRAADTASKALESASGRSTTEALQRLMETEKMSGKSSK